MSRKGEAPLPPEPANSRLRYVEAPCHVGLHFAIGKPLYRFLPLVILGGFFLAGPMGHIFLDLVIVAYAVMTVFNLVTLPVEFDASRRAKLILMQRRIVTQAEFAGVSKVLNAAALTYVAAALVSLLHLLRLIALRERR